MDRSDILTRLQRAQQSLDYSAKAGRRLWQRTAQDAGRETLDMALMTIRQLDEARAILVHCVEMGAFNK